MPLKTPKWTVLFNMRSTDGYITNTVRLFFDSEMMASEEYIERLEAGEVPTKRPFHETDKSYLLCHTSEL